jgi:beta-1,4-mannosyl-glycoprotein beta-1,4-N-acetylglucosaminyltransferase
MIYDCFMINKELDMLEFRLKELNDYVDYFIIIESTKTHTNNTKELYYNNNKSRYIEYSKKVIHIVMDDDIVNNLYKLCPNNVTNQWIIENGTRIFLTQFILVNDSIKQDDIIMMSDLDEIPDVDVLKNINQIKLPTRLCMDLFYYNFGLKTEENWPGTTICNKSLLYRLNLQELRLDAHNWFPTIKNGGYHLTYFFSPYDLLYKLNTYGHSPELSKNIKNIEYVKNCLDNKVNLFTGEQIISLPINKLPKNYKFLEECLNLNNN